MRNGLIIAVVRAFDIVGRYSMGEIVSLDIGLDPGGEVMIGGELTLIANHWIEKVTRAASEHRHVPLDRAVFTHPLKALGVLTTQIIHVRQH